MENIHLFSYYTIPVKLEDESFNIVPFGSCPIYKCKKEMKGISILFVLLFFFCNASIAQTLKGIVTDNQHPLPYATIRLLTTDSTFVQGTRTDSVGTFSLTTKHPGNYLLHVTSIGYNAKTLPVSLQQDTQLLPITLQANSVTLNEVTVEASSYVRDEDKLLIYPDKQQVKHSFTGYDLLYRLMIPGVDVDRLGGKVTSMGKEASLYIDGQPVGFREVQSLRPRDVEKVEYHDMPEGKYADDFVAINFITKKYTTGGYVSLDAKQTIGYLNGDYNAVVKLNRGNTDYTLFVGHQMNKYDGETEDMNEQFHFPDREVVRHTATLENRVKNNSQYAQFNVSNRSDKRTLTGKFSLVRNDAPQNDTHDLLEYSNNLDGQESFSRTKQSGLKPSMELYGYFNLADNQYLETKLTGNYTHNKYAYQYNEADFNVHTDANEDVYEFLGQATYGITFNERHSLNAKIIHSRLVSSAIYEGTSPSWQHLWSGETIAYAEYKYRLSKALSVKLSPGVSFLRYRLHGTDQTKAWSPRFQTRIRYSPAPKHQLALDGSIGNSYPRIERLNSAEQVVDSLQIKRGNPNQKVCEIYRAMFSYSTQLKSVNVALSVAYEGYTDVPTPVYFIENNKVIQTNNDNATANGVTVNLSLGWKVSDSFRLKADGSWMYVNVTGCPYILRTLGGRLQADYYWKDFAFSAYGQSRTEGLVSDLVHTTTPASYGLFAAWSHGSWYVEAGTDNPFTKHRRYKYSFDSDVYNYQRTATCRINQQTGYIKVAYTFDFGRKTSRDSRDVNTHINSAILKAN